MTTMTTYDILLILASAYNGPLLGPGSPFTPIVAKALAPVIVLAGWWLIKKYIEL